VATTRTKVSDFTGRQREQMAKEAAAEQAERADQIAMATVAAQEEFDTAVYDVTQRPDNPTILDEVVEVGVTMADDSRVVRVMEDIEEMTVGRGTSYTFKAGGKYKVPGNVADRLEELGYLSYR
jgi:hypothetical protein